MEENNSNSLNLSNAQIFSLLEICKLLNTLKHSDNCFNLKENISNISILINTLIKTEDKKTFVNQINKIKNELYNIDTNSDLTHLECKLILKKLKYEMSKFNTY